MPRPGVFLVATIRRWNIDAFHRCLSHLPGEWHLVTDPSDLTIDALRRVDPELVFFPHWSWKIPADIYSNFECIGFHETDLPYGRGGSPIQNLIARGHSETKVSAFRVGAQMDEGDIYAKAPLSLLGDAEEIFLRNAETVCGMIARIAAERPAPVPQVGEPELFARRTPAMSRIGPELATLEQLFDHIRMLDAEGYPPAELAFGRFVLKFTRAARRVDRIVADVEIRLVETDDV